TWTPTAQGQTTAGTCTYTTQRARYTKIGDIWDFELQVAWTDHTGTGNLSFPLPITPAPTPKRGTTSMSIFFNQMSFAGDQVEAICANNATSITIRELRFDGSGQTIAQVPTSGNLSVSGRI